MATSNSQYKLIGQIKYALIKIKEWRGVNYWSH
jgi:hypothetical protein